MATGCEGIDWPAWVQAVGSVLALILTGLLAVFEVRRRRIEDRARVAEQLRARVAILEFAALQIDEFMRRQKSDERKTKATMIGGYEGLRHCLSMAEQVKVVDMPSPMSVRWLVTFHGVLVVFNDVIEKHAPQYLDAKKLNGLKWTHFLAPKLVEELNKEADRIEQGGSVDEVNIEKWMADHLQPL